ncbi:hypothetical protein BSR29_06570 [Boudabousia liubingyangii]|uniref:Uncharacterized protein n=1 Tax=Boudabousia liubingyangii TaxID=1921764 RepID=A0A1Q5PKW7_9ACTO|nr:hypothetical protein [Boudabousia liubingyangii]OKL46401.1 hypothetical protein BSR28_07710 [Boudabousia liubingyangii]OKL47277.1 hypothetical protein BSR29_06570 [Boudabousia liubingyangii]
MSNDIKYEFCGVDFSVKIAAVELEMLIAELESRYRSARRAEDEGLRGELAQAHLAQISLLDRLRGAYGKSLVLNLAGDAVVNGTMSLVGDDWFVFLSEGKSFLIPLGAIKGILGLAREDVDLVPRATPLRLNHLLRELSEREVRMRFRLGDTTWNGRVLSVGKDWFEILEESLKKKILINREAVSFMSLVGAI